MLDRHYILWCFFVVRPRRKGRRMSLGSYSDIQIFPRVGVFEGFFWTPCSFLVYLPYSMHAFSSLFSLGYPMVTQPLQNNASLGSNPRGVPYLAVVVVLLYVLRFTLSIYLFLIKFGVWSFVRTQTVSSMLHVFCCALCHLVVIYLV